VSSTLRWEFLAPEDARWTSLLERVTHDFYHLPSYVRMCAEMENGEAGAFYAVDGGNELMLPMILREVPDLGAQDTRGWRDATSPYGYPGPIIVTEGPGYDTPAAFVEKALETLLVLMRERRILTAFVRFHPLLQPPLEPFAARGRLVMHGHTVSIDLTRSAEEIWAGVRVNHQRQIRTLERRPDVCVEEDRDWSRLPDFIATYRVTMDRVKATASYYFGATYFSALRRALGDRLHLIIARFGEQLAAGVAVTECCGFVQYHLAATAPEFFKDRPQKVLCRDTWLWAQRRGARVFHLGGGVGGREDGLFHFKAGFSDLRHPFYTWRICSEPTVYERLVAAWLEQNTGGSATTEFFPAYREHRTAQNDGGR
jgi:hypothetical protein